MTPCQRCKSGGVKPSPSSPATFGGRATTCQRCQSGRVADLLARCSDMCSMALAGKRQSGYVPRDMGVGGGDDVGFVYCLDCGQIQGCFPVPTTRLEHGRED